MPLMHETRRLSTNDLLESRDVDTLTGDEREQARAEAIAAIAASDDPDRCILEVLRDPEPSEVPD